MCSLRNALLTLGLAALIGSAQASAEQAARPEKPPGRYALLVGVTDYPQLARRHWLEGGANDVVLLRELLSKQFGFPPANLVTLSEADGKKDARRLPTRANIERECKALAARVRKGDQVVVLLSGHGSRQPEARGTKRPQGDGFDKTFLPRDVTGWNDQTDAVPNAITGRELGAWLRPIPEAKASLWVIVDACHSGNALRGTKDVVRKLEPARDLRAPEQVIRAAEKRAGAPVAVAQEVPDFPVPLGELEGVVLTYACRAAQVTVEGDYPHPATGTARRYGLFTHSLYCLLSASSEALSYRELVLRVQKQYATRGREAQVPVILGTMQDVAVLGQQKIARPTLAVTKDGDKLFVNAGAAHGLTRGSILAVYPPAGEKGGLKGHVRVTEAHPIRCEVEPVAHAKVRAPREAALVGGRAAVVEVNYDDLKLTIAVDRLGSVAAENDKGGVAMRKVLTDLAGELKTLSRKQTSPIAFVADPAKAAWLARWHKGKVYLLRAAEWQDDRPAKERAWWGPAEGKTGEWLNQELSKIARAEGLKAMASQPLEAALAAADAAQPRVEVVVRRSGQAKGKAASERVFYSGDSIDITLRNPAKFAVDVTVLFVNSHYGIFPLYPGKASEGRLDAGGSATIREIEINDAAPGIGQVVVIATRGRGEAIMDFTFLAQASLQRATEDALKRGGAGKQALHSPLGRLMRQVMFQEPGKRGGRRDEMEDYTVASLPVRLVASKRPAGK